MFRIALVGVVLFATLGWVLVEDGAAQELRSLTFRDMMQFRTLSNIQISDDGRWGLGEASPDRGDGEVLIFSTYGERTISVPRGSKPTFSKPGEGERLLVFMTRRPTFEEAETTKDKKKLRNDLVVVDPEKDSIIEIKAVEKFEFSDSAHWLVYEPYLDESDDESSLEGEEEPSEIAIESPAEKSEKPEKSQEDDEKKPDVKVKRVIVRDLRTGDESFFEGVSASSLHKGSSRLFLVLYEEESHEQVLRVKDLDDDSDFLEIEKIHGRITSLTTPLYADHLSFVASPWNEEFQTDEHSLRWWDGSNTRTIEVDSESTHRRIPEYTKASWTRNGERLFFGYVDTEPEEEPSKEKDSAPEGDLIESAAEETSESVEPTEGDPPSEFDPFDVESLLEERELDVWHWNDPLINPQQKKTWDKEKERTRRGVLHVQSGQVVLLDSGNPISVSATENSRTVLGLDAKPYEREMTWDGRYVDLYAVDLSDGSRVKIAERHSGDQSVSPDGRFIVSYRFGHWYLFDLDHSVESCLTDGLDVSFADVDHDYPSEPGSYGLGGWLEGDQGVLLYDKFDIWLFPLGADTSGENVEHRTPICVTSSEGRTRQMTFRLIHFDEERESYRADELVWLSAYHQTEKHKGFYSLALNVKGPQRLFEGRKRHDFVAKAKNADAILYTRQSYREFPDVWMTDSKGRTLRRLTDVNPQVEKFDWGNAELVQWNSLDGKKLQGVLIKPENFKPGEPIPILVYYYRFFSQRLFDFNTPVINHRPCFPFYASHGYGIFLPDIRFEIGRPGFAATKCLVPGLQKLIDSGVADPKAIGLHGHSWSGYQTAFMITQTDLFACAIAGAPVANMTSAYSGIRHESGMARQFQYEKTQSRIGGSLWDYPERYIENSPVFFADRITTPLLIQFGDHDGAVPWEQGIELYLAMRRLDKECVFLQYRGEPHHLKKYPNKLDYAMKMKEYLDHYLKGEEAKKWITEGVPYRGK